jgi:hypothetical protein
MAIALVAKTAAGSANGNDVTTSSIDTTGATLLLICYTSTDTGSATPTDSKSNTWNALTDEVVGGGERTVWFWSVPTTVGSGHTVSVTDNGKRPSLAFYAFSGTHASSPFDAENAGGNNFGSTVQPGSVTPGQDDSLIVQGISFNVDGTLAINGGYTHAGDGTDYVSNNGTTRMGLAAAYLIQTTATATNPTWTHTPGSSSVAAVGAVFKPAGGAEPVLNPWFETNEVIYR